VRPIAVGMLAHAALQRAGGRARVLARLTSSTYLTAHGQILWLGPADGLLHPRAILGAPAPDHDGADVRVDTGGLRPWRPAPPALGAPASARLAAGWPRLAAGCGVFGPAGGFGPLLTGMALAFPLAGARAAAEALAMACARDDARAAADAAVALLGAGDGLTPSGDDYVGAALFARHLLAVAGLADATAWRGAAETVLAVAPARTHPIGLTLLGDLAAGLGWAPLYELVAALAIGDPGAALEAAGRLTRLGHSSGWDLLAGLGAGLGVLSSTAPA
jgi:Protein of unknown function (DUF2877)